MIDQKLIEDFNNDSELSKLEARIATSRQRKKALGIDLHKEIISSLKSASVPQKEIDELIAELNKATNKNKALARVLQTSTKISQIILNLL